MALNISKMITDAHAVAGPYNWPQQFLSLFEDRANADKYDARREDFDPGGKYGNTFLTGLRGMGTTGEFSGGITDLASQADQIAFDEGIPFGEAFVKVMGKGENIKKNPEFATAMDAAFEKITPQEALDANAYYGRARFLNQASDALRTNNNQIASSEQQLQQAMDLYNRTGATNHLQRAESIRSQIAQLRQRTPELEQRVNRYTSELSPAYEKVKGANLSLKARPIEEVTNLFFNPAVSSLKQQSQSQIDQTPAAQQAAQQATQQAAQQAAQPTTSGLPAELTNIAVDNDYSVDEANIVENLLRTGRLSTQQVSDYFNLPVGEINSYLSQNYGYTPEQISSVASGTALSGITGGQVTDGQVTDGQVTNGGVSNDQQGFVMQGTGGQVAGGRNTLQAALSGQMGAQAQAQAQARQAGMTPLQFAQAGGLGANVDQRALQAAQQGVGADITRVMQGQPGFTAGTLQGQNIRYQDPNVIGGIVNMPQTGVAGAEAALQGGLAGGLAGLQQGLATGATGLTGAVASGLQELRRALGQGRQDITTGYGRAEAGFQPYMAGGQAAQAQLEALTGARGQEAFQQAYQESPYIQFLREQGMRANLAGAAATGGLGGGNVQRELQRFGQGLASQGLQQQIQNLQSLAGQGLQATQGAGGYAAGGAQQLAGLEQAQGAQALGAMRDVGGQLANLGLYGGREAANLAYGTGQQLAAGRQRAGELLAQEISGVSRDTSNLAAALGGDISGVYGAGAQNMANLLTQSGMSQAEAARVTANLLANIATGQGGQVAGLGTSVGQPQQQQGMLGQVAQLAGGIGTGLGGYAAFKELG
jgi:hypothetical protein